MLIWDEGSERRSRYGFTPPNSSASGSVPVDISGKEIPLRSEAQAM